MGSTSGLFWKLGSQTPFSRKLSYTVCTSGKTSIHLVSLLGFCPGNPHVCNRRFGRGFPFSCESVLFMSSWTMLQRLSCWMTCVFTGSDFHVDRTTCSRVCWNIYCKFSEIPYLKSLLLDDSFYVLFLINIKDLMFCSSSEKRPPPKGIKLSMGFCSLC